MRPDFGKYFFDKHQTHLVAFANTFIGRRFFQFKKGFGIADDFRVMELGDNFVSGNWKLKGDKIEKTAVFSVDNHYQKRLEHAYSFLTKFLPLSVASQLLEPSAAFGLALPLVALTTDTFYTEGNPETNAVDGLVVRNTAGTWAEVQNGAGTLADDNSSTYNVAIINENGTQWTAIGRGVFIFYTASIDNAAVVSGATVSFYVTSVTNSHTAALAIVGAVSGSTTALATADYASNRGAIRWASDTALGSVGTGAYQDFALNATGIAGVSLTAHTKIGVQIDKDLDNSEPTKVTNLSRVMAYMADYGSNKPKLVVTYTTPAAYYQTCSEVVSISQTINKTIGKPLSQIISIAGTMVCQTTRIFLEMVVIGQVFGATAAKVLTEIVSISGTLMRVAARTISEVLIVADGAYKTISRYFTETITVVGALGSMAIGKVKTLSEAVNVVDGIVRGIGHVISEAVSVADGIAKQSIVVFNEVISVSASFVRQTAQTFTETVGIAANLGLIWNGITAGKWSRTQRKAKSWSKTERHE